MTREIAGGAMEGKSVVSASPSLRPSAERSPLIAEARWMGHPYVWATRPTAQIWKSSKFTIERNQGKVPGTVIFRLSGPFTARDMHASLSPSALRNTFEPEEEGG